MTDHEYVFVNTQTGEIYFRFTGEMDAAYAFVHEMEHNRLFADERGLENWLNKRAYRIVCGKTDTEIIQALELQEMAGKLGRMTDGQCLYALLTHFAAPGDPFAVYPVRDTIHACLFSDYRFFRIFSLAGFHAEKQIKG